MIDKCVFFHSIPFLVFSCYSRTWYVLLNMDFCVRKPETMFSDGALISIVSNNHTEKANIFAIAKDCAIFCCEKV